MEQCASLAVLATFHGKKVVARKSIQHKEHSGFIVVESDRLFLGNGKLKFDNSQRTDLHEGRDPCHVFNLEVAGEASIHNDLPTPKRRLLS